VNVDHLDLTTSHGKELARQLGLSQKLDDHLTRAIAEFSPQKEGQTVMRGLARLSNLTESLVKQMDAKADAVADRLVAAEVRHTAALSKFEEFTAAVETAATQAEAALGQISNMPPPSA
jgi:hypothetical protein